MTKWHVVVWGEPAVSLHCHALSVYLRRPLGTVEATAKGCLSSCMVNDCGPSHPSCFSNPPGSTFLYCHLTGETRTRLSFSTDQSLPAVCKHMFYSLISLFIQGHGWWIVWLQDPSPPSSLETADLCLVLDTCALWLECREFQRPLLCLSCPHANKWSRRLVGQMKTHRCSHWARQQNVRNVRGEKINLFCPCFCHSLSVTFYSCFTELQICHFLNVHYLFCKLKLASIIL